MNQEIFTALIQKIKQKKQLESMDDQIVYKEIVHYLLNNPKIEEKLKPISVQYLERSKIAKQLIKDIRAGLHKQYGLFWSPKLKRIDTFFARLEKVLEKHTLTSKASLKVHHNILHLHQSTRERTELYPSFFKRIWEVTGTPKSILDLASGLNAIALPYMHLEKGKVKYLVHELNPEDLQLIKAYASIIKKKSEVQIKTQASDLRKHVPSSKADVALCLKLFDLLTTKRSEEILLQLLKQCKYVVVSFSTKTTAQRFMKKKKRTWFEVMIKRNNLSWELIEFGNEMVYIIIL
jgi:16S rRNA (guanine(1405)-N(7))-methyltransferase